MTRKQIAATLLCATIFVSGAVLTHRDRAVLAYQNSPTPATVLAGTGTPMAAGMPCGPGQASATSATIYIQTNLSGNNIWKCQSTDGGVTASWQAPFSVPNEVSGATVSIGGSLLLLNSTTSGIATVAGAVAGQNCIATRADGALPAAGTIIDCAVTAANTVTVRLTALIAVTPSATTYNVRVFM